MEHAIRLIERLGEVLRSSQRTSLSAVKKAP